jgi:amino acid adenylation domain-containing protein
MVAVTACLHELIAEQAKRTPRAPAVAFEQKTLSYEQLERRANALAHRLVAQGVGPDVTVGLKLERSLELIVGILGILKAGGAYVPIDPSFPAERVSFIAEDSGARVVLDKGFDFTSEADQPPATTVQANHLAYVIYTSGSTGKPKGVGVEHRNIVNYVRGVIERLRLEPGMSYATVSTIAADLGNTVIFPSLVTGGCLHVIAQERAENGALLAEYFAREKIDVLKIVPSHFAALNPERVMPRKRLILGGEASRLDWIERLRMLAPDCEIYNHYGPTETTVGVLTYQVKSILSTTSGTLPLGKPLPNVRVELVDGEIVIGGAQVARGYLNRPELTAEKFAGGVYRTGDRGRLLADGSIEFCGRVDHQVKVHGYRVELGEIEAALRAHQDVRDAVVLLRDGELAAFVAPASTDARTLKDHLKARLPQYMVPSTIALLDQLPLNANGKLDRQALSVLQVQKELKGNAAGSETEKALAEIWGELLKVESIGVDDDVFDLGAHSLMAMKALAQIRERFDVNLSLRNLFERPTVAGLAEAVESILLSRSRPAAQGEREEIVL